MQWWDAIDPHPLQEHQVGWCEQGGDDPYSMPARIQGTQSLMQ